MWRLNPIKDKETKTKYNDIAKESFKETAEKYNNELKEREKNLEKNNKKITFKK